MNKVKTTIILGMLVFFTSLCSAQSKSSESKEIELSKFNHFDSKTSTLNLEGNWSWADYYTGNLDASAYN